MNNSISIFTLCLILFNVNFVSACTKCSDNPNPVSYPIADGTFIQDNLVGKWDDAQWQKEAWHIKGSRDALPGFCTHLAYQK